MLDIRGGKDAFSDVFSTRFGTDALRYSILSVVVIANLWAGIHFVLAGRTLREDLLEARAR